MRAVDVNCVERAAREHAGIHRTKHRADTKIVAAKRRDNGDKGKGIANRVQTDEEHRWRTRDGAVVRQTHHDKIVIAKENLVTLDVPDGFRVLRDLGRVTGAATRPHNMLRATFRSIGAFIGLAPTEFLTDAERAREEALDDVRAKATKLGADAVIKIRFEAVEQPDGSTIVMASGQAVRLAPKNYAA
ncbi:MAG TPA: heavy metal-binding domain-containing protein [Candidatus Baltobacteraceae bacterium]|nr:heavy metal-binding domain-containing protein [Candidatus Baltobacteraceae bacterium]